MGYIDDNIQVTSTNADTYAADKRAKKRFIRHERIRNRVWELDFLRGICVILMIFDHLMFDIGYLFGDLWYQGTLDPYYMHLVDSAMAYWHWPVRLVVQYIVMCIFFGLCGISCTFSRSNLKRGGILVAVAVAITIVTSLVGEAILFGVIHMLASAILIVAVIDLIVQGCMRLHEKRTGNTPKPTTRARIVGLICFVLGILLIIVEAILENSGVEPNNALAFLSNVFADKKYTSMDYFPLLPYSDAGGHSPGIVAVLFGVALGPLLYPKKRTLLSCMDGQFRWYRPVNFLGRHAAACYVLHQVVWSLILGLFTIIAIPNGWDLIVAYFF